MLAYPPARMRWTSKGRPSCFSKIGAMRATVLEPTVGIDPHRFAVGVLFLLPPREQIGSERHPGGGIGWQGSGRDLRHMFDKQTNITTNA